MIEDIYSVGRKSITKLNAQKAPPPLGPLVSELLKNFFTKVFSRLVKIELSIIFFEFLPLMPTIGL